MKFRRPQDLSAEEIIRFRADYAAGQKHVRTIAGELGLSPGGVYQLVRGLGLAMRSDTARGRRTAEVLMHHGVSGEETGAVGLVAVGRVLERRIVEQLLMLQRRAAEAPAGAKAELLARAIAHQTRALKSIRDWTGTLTEDEPADDTPPPRDLSELRDELWRHLERLRSEGGSEPLAGEPD